MPRLPIPGRNEDTWGDELNAYLTSEHKDTDDEGGQHSTIHSDDIITRRPWTDVRAFGATGDGTTDDTDAIQSAIDDVQESGGGVLFPRGSYLISRSLSITMTGTALVGEGQGSPESSNPRSPSELVWSPESLDNAMITMGDGGTTRLKACCVKDLSLNGQGADVMGFNLDGMCADSVFENVLCRNIGTGWSLGLSCFANRFYNCVVHNFSLRGWDLRARNHNTGFWGCKGWGCSRLSPSDTVRIGADEWCSQVSFFGCDFEAWNVTRQIFARECRALVVHGSYFEAKDGSLDELILAGTNAGTWVDGLSVMGCYMIGNGEGRRAINLNHVRGASVMGCFASGFRDWFLYNVDVQDGIFGSDFVSGMPEVNTMDGLTRLG